MKNWCDEARAAVIVAICTLSLVTIAWVVSAYNLRVAEVRMQPMRDAVAVVDKLADWWVTP